MTQDSKAFALNFILNLRAQRQSEFTEAQKVIPALQAAHEATAAAVRKTTDNYQAVINLLLKPVQKENGTRYEIAESLNYSDLEELRSKIDEAKSLQARALADLDAARSEVAKLQRSLNQIDRAIPVEETVEAA
jgi:chromosome segregation ATPase